MAATPYGSFVSESGAGPATFNVGDGGEAYGVADKSNLVVLYLLFATEMRPQPRRPYDG